MTLRVVRATTEFRFSIVGEPILMEGDKPNNVLLNKRRKNVQETWTWDTRIKWRCSRKT